MSRVRPVDITGAGCISAAGGTLEDCMTSLFEGRRSPVPPTRFASHHAVAYPVFEVSDRSIPAYGPMPPLASVTGRFALAAAYEAIYDAGLEPADLRKFRVGVCIGTTVGVAMNDEPFYGEYLEGGRPEMLPIIRFMRSNPADLVGKEFGLSGPYQTVVNACSSGTDAVGIGAAWIQSGLCDMVIAGGADELCHVTYNGFISLMITSDTPCRPFDLERKGLNLGEGAAMFVLEPEESRLKRNRRPRARFLGYAASSDAYHLTAPHPKGEGLRRAIGEGLRVSEVSLSDIAFVNAHGTATPDNDRVEGNALAEALPGIPFFSTKGYTGHTLGAAGAIEAAFTLACLERQMIPASAGFATPDPEVTVSPVTAATAVHGRAAISQSLAFGGCNGVLVLGKGED